ncbi:MAG: hypothetical protein UIH27_16675 [Ruminococcus sp.]|nr:hypothetical protein [Ruminococcus sp.]
MEKNVLDVFSKPDNMLYLAGGIFLPIAFKKIYDLVREAAVFLKERMVKIH